MVWAGWVTWLRAVIPNKLQAPGESKKKHLHSKHSYSELMCGMLAGSEGLNSYTYYVKQHQEKLIYYIGLFFIIY